MDNLISINEFYELLSLQFAVLWHVHGLFLGYSAFSWGFHLLRNDTLPYISGHIGFEPHTLLWVVVIESFE